LDSSSEEDPQRRPRRDKKYSPNSNDLTVEIPEFGGKLDLMNSQSDYTRLRGCLITRRFQKTRRLSLLLSCLESMHIFDGLTFVSNRLGTARRKLELGRRLKLN